MIKASPDSKNPSVILSCASDDEEDVEKKPPVRDTLSADQPARSARLLRGLRRKLSKTKSGDEKGDSASKTGAEKKDDKASTSKHDSVNGAVTAGPGEEDDAVSALSSSPSPPVSEYEGSHRGSWSTLLHAIGTAEMVQKVQRNAQEIKQEHDLETLKKELEMHVSGNYQIKFGPVLPIWQAVLVFILNFCIPGIGTMLSGVLLLSRRTFRTAEAKAKYAVGEHFLIVFLIGLSQLMTITFLFIGWIWALVWASWLIQLSMEHRKLVEGQKLLETHEQATGRMSAAQVNNTRPSTEPAGSQVEVTPSPSATIHNP
ncbi:protein stum-like [Symsagittifera roscoffensis]|uniref:protein stum-like n=1 Tax=Symsagittifera roscoffensis TaxID=84072 RepID=UPI00307B212C